MSHIASRTGEQLASALQTLGVHFILGGSQRPETLSQHPARLLAALSQSSEARLRLALIPLLLEHPEFSTSIRTVAEKLPPAARLTLQCYYSAAVWLQQIHRPRLDTLLGIKSALPDCFSIELGIEATPDPQKNLVLLATRQQELSGARINWLGTYHHAAQVWLKGLELKK